MITQYVNQYNMLMNKEWYSKYNSGMEAGKNVSSISLEKSKFTENTQANGKYKGWSPLGLKFYNYIYAVIVKQRGTNKRKMFEEEVKQMMQNKKKEEKGDGKNCSKQ